MTSSGHFQPRKPPYSVGASNKHFIMLIDSVGQDLKEDTTRMTDLQCTLSGASPGKVGGRLNSVDLESSRYTFTRMCGGWCSCWLGPQQGRWVASRVCPWTSSQYGSCVLRASIPRERGRSARRFDAMAWEVIEHEFHHIPWVTAVTKVHPGSGKGAQDPNSQWRTYQSHRVVRACGVHVVRMIRSGPSLINTIHHTSETQHVQNPNHLFCPPNMLSLCFFTTVNTIIPKLLEPETWELS